MLSCMKKDSTSKKKSKEVPADADSAVVKAAVAVMVENAYFVRIRENSRTSKLTETVHLKKLLESLLAQTDPNLTPDQTKQVVVELMAILAGDKV
jgi:hypothetical protein